MDLALKRVARFKPAYLVVPLGFDDPTIIVQEGGYRTRTLSNNANGFFRGLWEGRGSLIGQGKRPSNP